VSAAQRLRLVRDDRGGDAGSAIIEFVFVAVIVMVPLVYLVVAVAAVQRSQLGVAQAAREAGRAFATSSGPAEAQVRVAAAVRLCGMSPTARTVAPARSRLEWRRARDSRCA
jgi:Flp pilus assembly protein TadG